ncbi:MAG: PD-(D/E)XK nuclease family protein [Pseudomonadota bacterium]
MSVEVCVTAAATARLDAAARWLAAREASEPLLIVGPTVQAANEIVYQHLGSTGGVFGWHRLTLNQLASQLALPALIMRDNRVPVGPLGTQAAIARAIQQVREAGALGRYEQVASTPGFARAVDRTLGELRMADVSLARLRETDGALAAIAAALDGVLADAGLTDRTSVLQAACELVEQLSESEQFPLLGLPTLLLDPELASPLECRLLRAVLRLATPALVTLPAALESASDVLGEASLASLSPRQVEGMGSRSPASSAEQRLLERLQNGLFGATDRTEDAPRAVSPTPSDAGEPAHPFTLDLFSTPAGVEETPAPRASLSVFSAPGESRECVEIVRAIRDAAREGVAFDRMAVLLRAPEQYRPHLEEAFTRAGIPACFARGAVRPDPAGRAFLALLHCCDEGLSAHRFAEYLSLGEVPAASPAEAAEAPAAEWVAPDPELAPILGVQEDDQADGLRGDSALGDPVPGDPNQAVQGGTLRAPRRWEQLLHEAAVIGGEARWQRRLDGLRQALEVARDELAGTDEDVRQAMVERDLDDLTHLTDFALPVMARLAQLPSASPWGEWLDRLAPLASMTLRDPRRVLAVLSELRPMAGVGPTELAEVIAVLGPRLRELAEPPPRSRYGRVFVAPVASARAMAFDRVFVPGLAEKLFPQKISEDPILLDAVRAELEPALKTNRDRVEQERLALRLAVGAAREHVVLSYPRMDMEQGRPRVASFYSLEAIRAAEGELLDFEALAKRAERQTQARIGWPAPDSPGEAIDEAEHDLALLQGVLQADEGRAAGAARYLLDANSYLQRALRFRARRWLRRWTPADGLVGPLGDAAKQALASHALDQRTYSPTALQHYAACPYRFLLYAVHKLGLREVPTAIDQMDPLQRGSLVHDVQFHLFTELREDGSLPVRPDNLATVLDRLDIVLSRIARDYQDRLAPAIERVWDDGIAGIRADLRGWLSRMSEDESGFVPWAFELAFGLPDAHDRDARSVAEGVELASGIRLRGAIDLVERRSNGELRVTDYKTGKNVAEKHQIVGGGEHLQPVLYAQAAERMFAGDGASVTSGRLWYCTTRGDYGEHEVPYDDRARQAAQSVADTIGTALSQQFLPAAPASADKTLKKRYSTCEYCDYRVVCGPYEEERVQRKPSQELAALALLRQLS